MVLERVIPGVGPPQLVGVSDGHSDAKCALQIEVPQALTVSDRRCDYSVQCAIFVFTGRHAPSQKCRENVIAVLLVTG